MSGHLLARWRRGEESAAAADQLIAVIARLRLASSDEPTGAVRSPAARASRRRWAPCGTSWRSTIWVAAIGVELCVDCVDDQLVAAAPAAHRAGVALRGAALQALADALRRTAA